ncbi:hypothetical protein LSH36_257g02065 [Paralvinella palmiformis]|uniref:Uncharacterized protein n=1 Tax=Paralvinella palmiformis TaxID=53620 RepID=A0AAD9JLC5_9ANNE|nr:hypothetical protein LSH36_257g02065 [Paralvinella palmiformis]
MFTMEIGLIMLFIVLMVVYDWLKSRRLLSGLHKKAVFITGCDSGFGNALAKSLYTRGVPVFAGCLLKTSATKLQEETGNSLRTVIIDVTDKDSVTRAAQYVKDNLPDDSVLWGLVNNAGVLDYLAPLEFLDKRDFLHLLDVNLFGTLEVTKAFLSMLKWSKGRIVNMTSINADVSIAAFGAYTVSKRAAQAFSDTLRLEQAAWGIKVSAIKPAFYKTNIISSEMVEEKMTRKWNEGSPEVKLEYGEGCLNKGYDAKFTRCLTFLGSTVVDRFMSRAMKFEPKLMQSDQ